MPVKKITRAEVQARLASGRKVVLVEALPEKYFLDAHLPGAVNLPHDRVEELAPALLPDRSAEIIVYCASGPCQNSAIAAERLTRMGYGDVADYHEGKKDWIEAGLPVESGPVPTAAAA
jgi:rhodanese-related sulfurtransferase